MVDLLVVRFCLFSVYFFNDVSGGVSRIFETEILGGAVAVFPDFLKFLGVVGIYCFVLEK